MLSLVKVKRERPKARDEVTDLVGRMEVALRTCSRRLGDPVDSYLHIGTGFPQLSVNLSELRNYLGRAKTRAELERALEEADIKIVRDYSSFFTVGGKLVIPGSSIKGNVRSRIELSFVPKDGTVRSCLARTTRQPVSPPPHGAQGWRHFRIWSKALNFAREEPCDYSEGEGGVCLVCDLFGTAGLQGLINFSDFVGVSVDRATLMYLDIPTGERLEAVPPGSTFLGRVEFRNLRPAELGLLLYGMGLRNSREGRPVLLGKHKYRRPGVVLGVVRYSVNSLELAELSKPLKVRDITVTPRGKVSGDALDRLIEALISTTREEFGDELEDIDEVGELVRIEASA